MNDGPIYSGYESPRQRTMTLYLPLVIPGYGRIESEDGWMVFIAWMREEMEAHGRTLDALRKATAMDDEDNSYVLAMMERVA